MYDIISKLGQPCIFIRYNPDNKKSDIDILLKTVNKYLELSDDDIVWNDYGFLVEYLFYGNNKNMNIITIKIKKDVKIINKYNYKNILYNN